MIRSKRLSPIKKLAQDKEKSAAQALGQSLDRQRLESEKLDQLEKYRGEYLTDMENKIKLGVNGATLQHYHQFLGKLDLAITQQQAVLKRCGEQLSASQGRWQSKRSKANAISQVMNKMEIKEQKEKDKRESTQNDEMSTQTFLRRQRVNGRN